MNYKTQFKVWDVAFVLKNRECYTVDILSTEITDDWNELIKAYRVKRHIPTWLLSEDTSIEGYNEDVLFLSKQEVKDKLKEIEKAEKVINDFPVTQSVTWGSWLSATTNPYYGNSVTGNS